MRQNTYQVIDGDSAGALLAEDSLQRIAMKKIKEIKKRRPQVSRHLNIYSTEDAQKTHYRKVAKNPKQLRVGLLLRPSRPWLGKRGLPSLPLPDLVIRGEEMSMKFQQ